MSIGIYEQTTRIADALEKMEQRQSVTKERDRYLWALKEIAFEKEVPDDPDALRSIARRALFNADKERGK